MWAALRRVGLALEPALARHATKKTGGSAGKSRTSNAKYLGIKIYGDQFAKAGAIIMRQRGARYKPGENKSWAFVTLDTTGNATKAIRST